MILIDSSAWIEFLRNTGSRQCEEVDRLVADEFAVCDPIRMEILAGARDELHLNKLRRLLSRGESIAVESSDYDDAAALHRQCRVHAATVRKLIDCLIAAVAIRADLSILHADSDFDLLARHSSLQVEA